MNSFKYFFTLVIGVCLSLQVVADPKLAVHLLSYLAQDYGEAVQEGKVVNESEYAEQLDFLSEVGRVAKKENFPADSLKEILELRALIESKAHASEVSAKANAIKWLLIRQYRIATSPKKIPDLILGEKIYRTNCVQCHGPEGKGDGALGRDLDPAPTNFHDTGRMSSISPFQTFTTITLGVPGTGMQSYSGHSEHQRWSLAYYVHWFHLVQSSGENAEKVSLTELSSLSDNEILTKYYKGKAPKDQFIADFRKNSLTDEIDETSYFDSKLAIARKKLTESLEQYRNKNTSAAIKLSLESYLEGIEPVEPLLGRRELIKIEEAYGNYRSLLRTKNDEEVSNHHLKILTQINNLSPAGKKSSWNSILLSFGIVFREALEAVLVIVLLLSILKKLEAPKGRVWIHAGWIGALVSGLMIFMLVQDTLLANMGSIEKIEGYLGLLAVLVLVYVGLWFHGKQNIEQWKNLLRNKIHGQIIGGKMLGLAALSFTAVFREIIETIIFLKVLQLDGHETGPLFQGVLLAAGITLILGILMTKFYLRLNISRLISVSTYLILSLSFVILGKSVHALQLSGVVSSTEFFSFSLPAAGLFGTWEVLAAQTILVSAIAGMLFLSRWKK